MSSWRILAPQARKCVGLLAPHYCAIILFGMCAKFEVANVFWLDNILLMLYYGGRKECMRHDDAAGRKCGGGVCNLLHYDTFIRYERKTKEKKPGSGWARTPDLWCVGRRFYLSTISVAA